VICAIGFVIASRLSTFINAKYIACLSFGYVSSRMWGDHKPEKELAEVWFYLQPLIFGTIGAALLFTQINPTDVLRSFACIIAGQIMRILGAFLVTYSSRKYTLKERIYISMCWIPKAALPATLASVFYIEALAKGPGWEDYVRYGNYI
jgi:NhaP-type Na+/H+ or K+/H+ antiporter